MSGDARIWQRGWYFGAHHGRSEECRSHLRDEHDRAALRRRRRDLSSRSRATRPATISTRCGSIRTTPQRQILGVDQGAVVTLNGGKTWSSWYNQPTAQIYHVSTDNRFPYWVYGAQQDSGAAALPSRSGDARRHQDDAVPRGHRRRRERQHRARSGRSRHRLRRPRRQARPAHAADAHRSIRRWPIPTCTGAPGRCRWCSRRAIRTCSTSATSACSAPRRRRALGRDQPRPDARESRRAGERSMRSPRRTTSADGPRRGVDLRDRAVAARCATALGRHRRRPDLAHARRRRALGERHADGADGVVEGRHHRGLALRRRHRVRRDRPPSPRRSQAVHLPHARRRQDLAADRRRHPRRRLRQRRARGSGAQGPALRRHRARRLRLVRRRRSLAAAADEPAGHLGARHRRARRRSRHRHARSRLLGHGRRRRAAAGRCATSPHADAWLFAPATAIRVRLAGFTGTPMPKDEPMASNPPVGALHRLRARSAREAAGRRSRSSMRTATLVRRYSSSDRPPEIDPANCEIAPEWITHAVDAGDDARACTASSGRCATPHPAALADAIRMPTASGRRRDATRSS